jgi:hypothetical protein
MHTVKSFPAAPARAWLLRGALLASLPMSSVMAQGNSTYFGPQSDEFLISTATNYSQYWVRCAIADDGSSAYFSYNSGQDPFARRTTLAGAPLTPTLVCAPNLNLNIQDESETAISNGNQLVAWSERHGYDGQQMGIFGRVFGPGGAALGPEFEINLGWQASQWRPLIAARPSGGFVVAWSGDWDGNAYFRVLDASGAFLTSDVRVNTFSNGGQTDTALAIAPTDGQMLLIFVDYSGWNGVGTGLNLWARLYDQNGVPLQSEWPLNTPGFSAGDQKEPRAASDGLGRYIVVWEDPNGLDGSSWAVIGRRFAHDGTPLGAEFIVNTTTISAQRSPRVAADELGNFVVAWEDWSGGNADIRAQRFDGNGQRWGAEVLVNQSTSGDQKLPCVAMSKTSGDVVFSYHSPDAPPNNATWTDVYARSFTIYEPPTVYCTAKTNSVGCVPQIGWSGTATLSGADDFVVGANLVTSDKVGLLFYGYQRAAAPFYGGTMCVDTPVVRTPLQSSGGNTAFDDCSGTYSFAFTHAYMNAHALAPGTSVHAQFWSRDPGFALPQQNIGLTDALEFDVRP